MPLSILDKDQFKKWKLVLIMFFYLITEPSLKVIYEEGIVFYPFLFFLPQSVYKYHLQNQQDNQNFHRE